tara:strand:- start:315 stop:800 length:486 start_codon:yes stop_codon:yes gene_type:complete
LDDALNRFSDLASDATSSQLFAELHSMCDTLVGVKLFTCSSFDFVTGKAERIYTSDPEAYPLTGLKNIVPNRWTELVIDSRKPFLAKNISELRDIFSDHEKIEDLGLGAAINLPIFLSNRLLGTLNLLHENGYYSELDVRLLRMAALPAIVTFLAHDIPRA